MRKLLSLIAVLLVCGVFAFNAFATKADRASRANGIESVFGIGDLSSGETAEIDSNGNLAVALFDGTNQLDIDANGSVEVAERVKSLARVAGADGVAVDGPATVHSIIIYGDASASAGDYIAVHDSAGATGTEVVDVSIDAAKGTRQINFPGGIAFSTEVYVDLIDGNVAAYIIYE